MIFFNYYAGNIKKSHPLGLVNIYQFFDAIRSPKPHILNILQQIREADAQKNISLKAELKTQLFSFTPAVVVNGRRRYEDISNFTGLMVLDFDKLESIEQAQTFKGFLYQNYDFIIATWLSASKLGVRALVNIPQVTTVEEYKALFEGLAYHEMSQYKGFDAAPKNPVLPLFISHDPDLMCGDTPGIWELKYANNTGAPRVQYKYSENPTHVERVIKSAIDKINDNGHPQLKRAARALGGYVSAGYISQDEAESLICRLIDSNAYLNPPSKSGFKKSDIYKTTAKSMIHIGLEKSLSL